MKLEDAIFEHGFLMFTIKTMPDMFFCRIVNSRKAEKWLSGYRGNLIQRKAVAESLNIAFSLKTGNRL